MAGLVGCAGAHAGAQPADLLNATLWQARSVEYAAATQSIYRSALERLRESVQDCARVPPSPCASAAIEQQGIAPADLAKLPPAVILDLDETALDNAAYEGHLHASGDDFTDASWDAWLHASALASAQGVPPWRLVIPGAAEFTAEAARLNVRVFYVTNRACPATGACQALKDTQAVMSRSQPPFARATDDDAFRFAVAGQSTDKSERRRQIAAKFRIAMMLGDDLGDFVGGKLRDELRAAGQSPEALFATQQWGRTWFMLPNAMYGSWERALYAGTACPTEAQVPDAMARARQCRLARLQVKQAEMPAFASGDNPRLRVATWNLAWWMGDAAFTAWRKACTQPAAAAGLSYPPCDLTEQSDPNFHTDAATRTRRAGQFRDAVAQEQPDVLLLQEVRDAQAVRELLSGLGYSRVWTTFRDRPLAQSVGYALKDGVSAQWPPVAYLPLSVPDQSQRGNGKPLRPGAELRLPLAGKMLAILNVHLKASCRFDPIDAPTGSDPGHCHTLRAQVPQLERWLEERAVEGVDFMLGGDFNRAVANELGVLQARLDGSNASDPITPATRIGSLLKEISDGKPAGASLVFPFVPAPGTIDSKCHRGIDYLALGDSLALRTAGKVQPAPKRTYRYAPTPASPQGPSDHCMVSLDLVPQ